MVKHHRSKHTKKRSRSVKRSFKCGKKVKKQTRKTKTKIKTKNIVTYKKCGGNATPKVKHIPMAFSSTGDKVVYGETVKTWVSNGHEGGGKFEPYHYAYVMCAQDDYYGKCVLSSGVSSSGVKRKKMWRKRMRHSKGRTVRSVALRPARQDDKNRDVEDTVVVTGTDNGLVSIWTQMPSKEYQYDQNVVYHDDLYINVDIYFRGVIMVSSVAFSPDGTKVVAGCNDGTARIWTEHKSNSIRKWGLWFKDGRELAHSEHAIMSVEKGKVTSVAFNNNGTKVVAGYDDGTARIWEVKDKRAPNMIDRKTTEPMMIMMHNSSSNSVAFSPDGEKVVAGYHDGTVIIWDVKPVEEPAITNVEPDDIAIEGTGDNKNGAVSVDNTNAGTDAITSAEPVDNANAGEDDNAIAEKNGYDEESAGTVDNTNAGTDDSRVINGGWLKMPKMPKIPGLFPNKKHQSSPSPPPPSYPLAKCLKKMKGHSTNVTSLAFSPDGTKVVSGSDDKTVRIWDVVSDSDDNTVRILNVASGVQLKKIPVDNSPVDNSPVDNSPVDNSTVVDRTVSSVAFTDDDNVIFGYHYYERYKTNTKIVCIFNVESDKITLRSIVSD